MSFRIGSAPNAVLARRVLIAACLGAGLFLAARWTGGDTPSPGGADDLAAAELSRAAERANMCTAANATGVGLRGEYFAQESWQGAAMLVRVDASVDFGASLDWPAERASERPRSVRWSGWLKAPISGFYRFHADAPDQRVLVGRQLLAGAGAAPEARLEMAAGRFYPVVVEVSRLVDSNARLRLEWTAPHGARFVVPRALLYLPSEAVVKPAVAQ